MNARSELVSHGAVDQRIPDFRDVFHAHYPRIARVIARIVRDHGRAEELAAEVFWKYWRSPNLREGSTGSWLYRTAVRMGLDELRRQHRRSRFENLSRIFRTAPSPEQLFAGE